MSTRLAALQERRAVAWNAMRAIVDEAHRANNGAGRDLTAQELETFNRHDAELNSILEQIRVEDRDADLRTPRGDPRITDPNPGGSRAENLDPLGDYLDREETMVSRLEARGLVTEEDRSLHFGRWLRGAITGDWRGAEAEHRALSHAGAQGGYAVPQLIAGGIIDRFRARATLLRAGARTFEMQAAEVPMPKLVGGVTAAWHFDNATIAESSPTFGAVKLEAKMLTALVKAPLSLVEDAPGLGDAVERELAGAMAVEIDRVGLYGQGAAGEPLGIANTPDVNTIAAVGALTNYDDFADLFEDVENQNAPTPTDVVLSVRTATTLGKLKTGIASDNTPLELPDFMREVRMHRTAQVVTDEGGGGNEARIFAGGFEEVVVGIRNDLRILVLGERYIDAGQVGFLAFWRGDVAVLRPQAVGMLTGVTS